MISVIITCYNLQDYIERCITSIVNQTYSNLEIIIVNDCSTDDSLEVINHLFKIDNRLRLINNPENYGAGKSRKIGINLASGKYIALIDGDDYITPGFLQELRNQAELNNADIVSGNIICPITKTIHTTNVFETDQDKLDFLQQEKKTFINNKLIKKELWDKVPYCERRYIEDTFPYYQLIYLANKIVMLDHESIEYYWYDNREASLTHEATYSKHRLFTTLCWLDVYEYFQQQSSEVFKYMFSSFFIKNVIGYFLNDKRINKQELQQNFLNEYSEAIQRCEGIKRSLISVSNS